MCPSKDIAFRSVLLRIISFAALSVLSTADNSAESSGIRANEYFVRADLSLLWNPVPPHEESKSFVSREDGVGDHKKEYSIRKLSEDESQAPSESNARQGHGKYRISWLPLFLGVGVFFILVYFLGKKALLAKEKEIRRSPRNDPIKDVPAKTVEVIDVKPEGSRSELVFFIDDHEAFKLDDLLEAAAELNIHLPCSSLYKVVLKNGALYTVKRLKKLLGGSFKEFGQTMTKIGNMKHPNILLLVGYNSTPDGKLLIYKYLNNGSLFNLLDDHIKGRNVFPWNLRLYIAWGIARGLDFIHRSSENKSEIIPHGNLKPSNIIVGDNMEALISDYGLSKFLDLNGLCLYSSARYMAPEKQFSEQGDVYSFGVILLELLTGKTVENTGVDLPRWVKSMVREEWTGEVFDKEVAMEAKQWAFPLLNISLMCIADSPDDRPSIAKVLDKIEEAMNGQLQHQGPDSPLAYGKCNKDGHPDCCLLHSVIPETWDSPGSNY